MEEISRSGTGIRVKHPASATLDAFIVKMPIRRYKNQAKSAAEIFTEGKKCAQSVHVYSLASVKFDRYLHAEI
jgi:hypothetical protein